MNLVLFLLTTLVWGTTWIAIKMQLGFVPFELSIVYRFGLAGAIAGLYCVIKKIPLRFSLREHGLIMAQGILLFSVNYYFIYLASYEMASGLLAVIFSTIVFFNIIFKRLVFGTNIKPNVLLGAGFGIFGIALVFYNELGDVKSMLGFAYAVLGALISSLGNIMSAWNQKKGLPVASTNALGMAYGSVILFLFLLIAKTPVLFDGGPKYVFSLLYLALFGSVIGFWMYLTLLGRIGPDRAAYVTVVFPIIALAISTVAEGYQWGLHAFLGTILILAGNVVILSRRILNSDQSKTVAES